MRFSLISAIATVGSVVTAQPVTRALSSDQTVDGLKALTQKAKDLQGPAQSISVVNSPLIIIGQGPFPKIIQGNVEISQDGQKYYSSLEGTQPYTAEECSTITGSYQDFASVNVAYLTILSDKAPLTRQNPVVGGPVAASLRQVESAYQTITFKLIELCASTAQDLTSSGNSLNAALDLAIKKYDPATAATFPQPELTGSN